MKTQGTFTNSFFLKEEKWVKPLNILTVPSMTEISYALLLIAFSFCLSSKKNSYQHVSKTSVTN